MPRSRSNSVLQNSSQFSSVAEIAAVGPPARESSRREFPNNRPMLRSFARRYSNALACHIRRMFFNEQWLLGWRKRPGEAGDLQMGDFHFIYPPNDRFYADPFPFEKDRRLYIFFEEFEFSRRKGVISCIEVDEAGHAASPRPVLEENHHLSYPFLFTWGREIYLLSEARESATVPLYRAVEFPWRWKLEKTLLQNIWAADPTLIEHAGKFWLFASGGGERASVNQELNLFFADSPLGPWTSHPKNPIVSDLRRARPAGKLFRQGARLIRPGQDCSTFYGAAITLNRVEVLSEDDYRETPFARLTPGWLPGMRGMHTLNSSENFQVIDLRRQILRRNFNLHWLI